MLWHPAYVGIGSNLDGPAGQVRRALAALADVPQTRLVLQSSLFGSRPLGPAAQPDFVNAVAQIETRLSAKDLLATTLHIENLLGRTRTERWAPRVIDIDVLLYGDMRLSTPEITVPHPRMYDRAFVLVPLAELAPHLLVPTEAGAEPGETVTERAARLQGETRITRMSW